MKNNLDVKYLFLIALVALLTISIWFRHGYQLGTAEGGLPFNNLQRHAEVFQYTWADTNLGNATSYLVASYPTYFLLSLAEKVYIPAFIIEAFVFWFILSSAGIGVYGIARKLVGLQPEYALIAVFFYWVCPFVQVNIWSRFLYNHIFFLALLPVVLYFFIEGLINKSYKGVFSSILAILLFSYALTALALTILLAGLVVFLLIFFLLTTKSLADRVFYIKYGVLFAAFFILSNLWWISQFFSFGTSGVQNNLTQSVSAFFTTEGNISGLTQISVKLGSFIDLTRFIHYSFFYENSAIWSGSLITNKAFILNSLIFLLILIGIFFSRKHKILICFSLLFLISLLLAKGNNPPFGEIYTFFFVKLPFLQTFRNPIEKISLLTVLAGAILFASGLENIQRKYLSQFFKSWYLSVGVAFFLMTFWGWSFFSGLVFTGYKDVTQQIFSYETEVPDYYEEANAYINQRNDINRFLVLPLLGEGITYDWPIPYTGIDLYSTLFSKQNIALNTTIPYYYDVVGQIVNHQFSSKLVDFLPILGIDAIVLREDIDIKTRIFPNSLNSKNLVNDLENRGDIKKEKHFGPLTIYTLSPKLNWGKFYITNQVVTTNEKDFSKFSPLNYDKKVYIDPSILQKVTATSSGTIIVPNKITSYDWLNKYQKLSNEDIFSQLLYVKHSPDDALYPFVRSKEFLTSFLYTDYPKWVLFNTDLLGKRAVEICQYSPIEPSRISNEQLIQDYKNEYHNLYGHIKTIVDEKRSLKNEIFGSLVAQAVLLSRCNQLQFSFFRSSFIKLGIVSDTANDKLDYTEYIELQYDIPLPGRYFIKDSLSESNKKYEDLDFGEKIISYKTDEAYLETTLVKKDNITFNLDWVLDQPFVFDDYNAEYEIRIDYQTLSGDFLGFFVKQDIDTAFNPRYFQGINLSEDINTFEVSITPSVGAKQAQIGLTGNKNMFCSQNCLSSSNQLQAKITSLEVIKKRLKKPLFVMNNDQPVIESSISWDKVSRVEYKVNIQKVSSEKEVLVFSELFSNGWQIKEDKSLKHFLVNGYANGWIIDKPGSYTITVYHQPEDTLRIFYVVSSIGFLVVVASFFYYKFYGKKA